jgi:hypothetical protein
MPSLFRFLMIVSVIGAISAGGLYVLATQYEPEQREETKVVPGVKIQKE